MIGLGKGCIPLASEAAWRRWELRIVRWAPQRRSLQGVGDGWGEGMRAGSLLGVAYRYTQKTAV